jgi:hypothetical protein
MSGRSTVPKIMRTAAIVTMVVCLVGFVVTLILNAFFLDKFNEYGEVPIPGQATLHLPAGQATISFHTQIIGTTSGNGLPIPDLKMNIDPPSGVADPAVSESIGSTTTVNSDARVRVWVVQIPVDGNYTIRTDGNVSAFVSPRLAFGHSSSQGTLPWIFAGVFGFALLDLIVSQIWLSRTRKQVAAPGYDGTFNANFNAPNVATFGDPSLSAFTPKAAEPYGVTDDGARIEQLKTLAALRDSGALTQAEFENEKRRLLDGR